MWNQHNSTHHSISSHGYSEPVWACAEHKMNEHENTGKELFRIKSWNSLFTVVWGLDSLDPPRVNFPCVVLRQRTLNKWGGASCKEAKAEPKAKQGRLVNSTKHRRYISPQVHITLLVLQSWTMTMLLTQYPCKGRSIWTHWRQPAYYFLCTVDFRTYLHTTLFQQLHSKHYKTNTVTL